METPLSRRICLGSDFLAVPMEDADEPPWSPERRLLAVVLLQALADLASPVQARRCSAARWFGLAVAS
jgi:hypothetical protein